MWSMEKRDEHEASMVNFSLDFIAALSGLFIS